MRNEKTGDYIQVGRSCVKDYIGCDIALYASYLSIWTSLEEYCESLNKEHLGIAANTFDNQFVLEQTCAEIRSRGFISRAVAAESDLTATSTRISLLLNADRDKYGNLLVPEYEVNVADKEIVGEFKEWVNTLEPTTDYYRNVKSLMELSYVENGFQLNTLVSAIGVYIKQKNQKAQEKEQAQKSTSEFIGSIGTKVQLTNVKPECIYSTDGIHGMYYKYKFVYNDNVFIWGTSKDLSDLSSVSLIGTVKAHNTFKGIKQTEITRCKLSGEKATERFVPSTLDVDYNEILNLFYGEC